MLDKDTKLKVHQYEVLGELPDLFTLKNGKKVNTQEDWQQKRKEMFETAVVLQYGDLPEPEFLDVEVLHQGKHHSYKIITGRKARPVSFVMTFIPSKMEKSPVIVDGDLCFPYAFNKDFTQTATDKNVAWAFFNRTELAHDVMHEGRKGQLYEAYPEYHFGAIRAWAWGYSRCVDALLKLGLVDESFIVFSGHSRGGKTSMLAGVLDSRASIVNPNETCAGSASCYRIHMQAENEKGEICRSETLDDLIHNFDFWMSDELAKYRTDEANLPFDAHYLKALVAPRTLFLSDSVHDIWGNPIGAWMTTMAAKEAYKMLGAENELFWYFRDGPHFHDVKDVQMLVNLICHKKWGEPLCEDFFRRPFDEYPPIYTKLEE